MPTMLSERGGNELGRREYNRAYYLEHRQKAIDRAKKWAAANTEKRREISREWARKNSKTKYLWEIRRRKTHPIRYLISKAKARSKRYGIPFEISVEDVSLPTHCPLLNIPLDPCSDLRDFRPSLDRLDNSKGYIRGNVVVVSWRANRLKGDATADELETIARNLRKLMGG